MVDSKEDLAAVERPKLCLRKAGWAMNDIHDTYYVVFAQRGWKGEACYVDGGVDGREKLVKRREPMHI
jgi:hypothetical protein